MKLKDLQTKRKLDTYIGVPAMLGLQILARGLGFILKRDHSSLPIKTVVVMKFQGMGSLAIAKPAIASFKAKHPECRIVFWGSAGTCALARLMPEFDQVIELKDRTVLMALTSLLTNLLQIWKLRPEWVFDLEVYSKLSSIFALFTTGRNRAGFALETVSFRRNILTHLVFFNRYYYLGRAYETLMHLPFPQEQRAPLPLKLINRWTFEPKRLKQLSDTPYIVINPHAGGLSLERRWPIESFDSLIGVLLEKYPTHRIVLVGHGREELEHQSGIRKDERIISLTNQLKLDELISCLAFADLLISNDTGPLHLGLLTSTPAIALFGPTSAKTYLPERSLLEPVSVDLYCSPCVHHWWPAPCGGDNQCMKQIKVSQIIAVAEKLIGSGSSHSSLVETSKNADNSEYRPGLVYTAITSDSAD